MMSLSEDTLMSHTNAISSVLEWLLWHQLHWHCWSKFKWLLWRWGEWKLKKVAGVNLYLRLTTIRAPVGANNLWHSSDLEIGLLILQRSSALLLLLKSGTESNRIYTALRIENLLHNTSEYCKPLLFTVLLTQDGIKHYTAGPEGIIGGILLQ